MILKVKQRMKQNVPRRTMELEGQGMTVVCMYRVPVAPFEPPAGNCLVGYMYINGSSKNTMQQEP